MIMNISGNISVLVVCLVLSVSGLNENLPVLLEVADTVLFRVSDDPQPFSLVCRTTTQVLGVIYTWHKNGKFFNILRNGVVQRMGEGSLIFITPTSDDEGQYQCFAFSTYGTASTRVINARRTYIDASKTETIGHHFIEGKPYKFNCTIPDGRPGPEIDWIIRSETNPKIWKRILDRRITKSPEGALCFTNVTRVDFDKKQRYVCRATTPALDKPMIISEHYAESVQELICPLKKKLVVQYVSKNIVAKLGGMAYLYCLYGGTPQPSMKWFKDGQEITNDGLDRVSRYNWSNGRRLIIRDVFAEDEGIYTCVADNKVGAPQVNNINVTVVSPPVFTKSLQPLMTATRSENVTISCEILGVPSPDVTWTYNAAPLKKQKATIAERKSDNTTASVLSLTNAQRSDMGYYGCRGVNLYGDLYAIVYSVRT